MATLSYWAAAIIVMLCFARRESLRRRHAEHRLQMVLLPASGPTPVTTSVQLLTSPPRPSLRATVSIWGAAHFWYPQTAVLVPQAFSRSRSEEEGAASKTIASAAATPSLASAPTTMLSVHVDRPDQTIANALPIQCRTTAAVNNGHGRVVTIHGIVTEEVVSSTGKILIMAGSRVVGSAMLDPENGRFKSNGRWSVFFDDTELKVQALLLDRSGGLPGVLGHESNTEEEALQKEAALRDGRYIVVPRNAPFFLELHGEMLLRDFKTGEASN